MNPTERVPMDDFEEIDAALRGLELEPVPPALTRLVLEKVRALRPLPVFRLKPVDYLLGLFAAVMLGGVFFVSQVLPPFFRVSLTNELVYWFNRFQLTPAPFVLGLVAAGAAGLALLLGVAFLVRGVQQSADV